jgi:hypothetical protein
MKKLIVMAGLFVALFTANTASAQGGGDPQQMRQRMIERVKPQLVEKAKITDAEADKVLDIYMASQPQRREVRMDQSMSDEDKAKKIAAIEEEATKKYKAIPLSDEKLKAVNDFFDEMRKNMQNRRNGGN